jgi:hypothetical protein
MQASLTKRCRTGLARDGEFGDAVCRMRKSLDDKSSSLLRLSAALQERTGEIADATVRRVRGELPGYYEVTDTAFEAAGYGALPTVLGTAWVALEQDGRRPDHLPSPLVDEARNAARTGIPWDTINRTYLMTHEAIWDVALDEVSSWNLSRGDQRLLLRSASKFLFRVFEWMTGMAAEVYAGERDEWRDRRAKHLLELVGQAIDGIAIPDTELGYGTGQQHLGVIGWGRDPAAAISAGARALGGELLMVPAGDEATWAWIGRSSFPAYRSCLDSFDPPPGTRLAIGGVGGGRQGFIRSHRQAQLASSVAVRRLVPTSQAVTAYPDISIETFALADESRARMFVDHVLGSLGSDDNRCERLRQTLRVYCDAGQSAAIAAERLGVSERTVRYRMQALEDELQTTPGSWLEPWLAVRLLEAIGVQETTRKVAALASMTERSPIGQEPLPDDEQRHGGSGDDDRGGDAEAPA